MKIFIPTPSSGTFLRAALLTLCLLVNTTVSQSAVIYTSSYEADTLPNATQGTLANPLWHRAAPTGTYHAEATGGRLVASTTTVGDQWWAVGTNSSATYTGSTPGVWNTGTGTVDFRLSVSAGSGGNAATGNGFMIQLSDSANRFYTFYIGPSAFTFQNGAATSLSVTTTSLGLSTAAFHTYRIALDNGKASLYVDDRVTPVFDSVAGITFGTATRTALLFGDAAGAMTGSFQLDHLRWSNTTAHFAAPVPEPATALLGVAAGLLLLCTRRGAGKP